MRGRGEHRSAGYLAARLYLLVQAPARTRPFQPPTYCCAAAQHAALHPGCAGWGGWQEASAHGALHNEDTSDGPVLGTDTARTAVPCC